MNTRDFIKGKSIPVIGQEYAISVEPGPIMHEGKEVDGLCVNEFNRIRLRDDFALKALALAALGHEAGHALQATLDLKWLTHERIYLLSEFFAGVTMAALGIEEDE